MNQKQEIIDKLKGIRKYWCLNCNCYHRKNKNKQSKFYLHSEFMKELNLTELFKINFKKSWKREKNRQIKEMIN